MRIAVAAVAPVLAVFSLAIAASSAAQVQGVAGKPTVTAFALDPETSRLSITDIETNAPIRLEWNATVLTGATFGFEITYDLAATSEMPSPKLIVLDVVTSAGKNQGTVQSPRTEVINIRPQQIVPLDQLPGQHGVVGDGATDPKRDLILRVFKASDRLNADFAGTASWQFIYDTKPPAPPTIAKLIAGENRLEVLWNPPSPDTDVQTYEVLCIRDARGIDTSSTATITLSRDRSQFEECATGISPSQTSFSITELKIGVPAAVAVQSVDAFGNVGALSNIEFGTPTEVTDFFELYKAQGGAEDGGFCFVATAAFGSYAHPTVHVLRAFRDGVLRGTPLGTGLIWAYYRLSPPLAAEIAKAPSLRRIARIVLLPVAGLASLWLIAPLLGALVIAWRLWARLRTHLVRRAVSPLTAALLLMIFAAGLPVHAYAKRPEPKKDSVGLGFELKGGPYLPAMGEFAASAEGGIDAFARTFGSDPNPLYSIGLDAQLYRGVGTAGVGGSFGFMQFVGLAFFGETGNRSSDTTVFNLLPLTLTAFYRFDWLSDRATFPLVPYGRFGLAYHVWWVTTGSGDIAREGDQVGRGGKFGYTATAGLSLLLNALDPGAAQSLHESTGVRGTYVFGEVQHSQVNGFGGAGFDLSDTTWNLGLYIEL